MRTRPCPTTSVRGGADHGIPRTPNPAPAYRCPSGTTHSPTRSPRDPRCPPTTVLIRTTVSISPSSAPAYTGLWTAYYLKQPTPRCASPSSKRDFAGFGASGRNGGWCSAIFPVSLPTWRATAGRDAAIALRAPCSHDRRRGWPSRAAEGIDCRLRQGRHRRARPHRPAVGACARRGRRGRASSAGDDDLRDCRQLRPQQRLERDRRARRLPTRRTAPRSTRRGWCAAWPTSWSAGVRIYEQTPVTAHRAGVVAHRAGPCVPTTSCAPPRGTRPRSAASTALAPVYSLMHRDRAAARVDVWEQIGLAQRRDLRRLPASDHLRPAHRRRPARVRRPRRAVPLRLADPARVRPRSPRPRRLERVLTELFPVLGDVRVTHTWGGALGVPRDWFASVGIDRAAELAWAGGYVGDGVVDHQPRRPHPGRPDAGRGTGSPRCPWVGHRSRPWEPNRRAGSARTSACASWAPPTPRRPARGAPRAGPRSSAASWATRTWLRSGAARSSKSRASDVRHLNHLTTETPDHPNRWRDRLGRGRTTRQMG